MEAVKNEFETIILRHGYRTITRQDYKDHGFIKGIVILRKTLQRVW